MDRVYYSPPAPQGGSWWIGVPREQFADAVRRELPRMAPHRPADYIDAVNAMRMVMWGTGLRRQQQSTRGPI